MSTATPATPETSSVIQQLAAIARDPLKGDEFRLKVNYKVVQHGFEGTKAIFEKVPVQFLMTPEPWLQRLFGDAAGIYVLKVSHEAEEARELGRIEVPLGGQSVSDVEFKWAAFESPAYKGPMRVIFPVKPMKATPVEVKAPPPPPPATPLGELAGFMTQQTNMMMQMMKSSEERTASALLELRRPPAGDPASDRYLQMMQEERRTRETEAKEARERYERERKEQREKEEAERKEREDRDRKDREERDRREQQERERAREQTSNLIQVLTKKPDPDPVTTSLIQKALQPDNSGEKFASLITSQGAFMAQMTQMTMQLLHTQAELNNQNAPENPFWGLAKTAIEAYMQSAGYGMEEIEEEAEGVMAALPPPKRQPAREPAAAPGSQATPTEPAQASLDGMEPEGEQGEEEEVDEDFIEHPLDKFDRLVMEMQTLGEVADALSIAITTKEFADLYKRHKGNVLALVTERYQPWVSSADVMPQERGKVAKERLAYLQRILPKAWGVLRSRGLLGKPPPPAKATVPPAQPPVQPQPQPPQHRGARPARKVKPQAVPQAAKNGAAEAKPAVVVDFKKGEKATEQPPAVEKTE